MKYAMVYMFAEDPADSEVVVKHLVNRPSEQSDRAYRESSSARDRLFLCGRTESRGRPLLSDFHKDYRACLGCLWAVETAERAPIERASAT